MDDLDIKIKDDQLIFAVRLVPNASKDEIREISNGELLIKVTAVPEKGKANKKLITFLAKKTGCPKSRLEIISGEKSRHKKLAMPGEYQKDLKNLLEDIP